MKTWHISDVHLSFDANWSPIKPMHLRRWAVGVWTYQGYLEKMVKFSNENIDDEDYVFITGDIVHDMKGDVVEHSLRWLRQNIKGTLIICRGNHDAYWQPAKMRQRVSDLPKFYIFDEGEIISIQIIQQRRKISTMLMVATWKPQSTR
jgi:predicted phosphohydrolase